MTIDQFVCTDCKKAFKADDDNYLIRKCNHSGKNIELFCPECWDKREL